MIAIILAGGTGTRLWPYSRSMSPKQFLNLGSTHESLFQETCGRLNSLVEPNNVYVIGSNQHENELKYQMSQTFPNFNNEQLLIEPKSMNTAPAILWGIMRIQKKHPNETVVILASDHLINDTKNFKSALENAKSLADAGYIVTFGICPDHAETGYGYIKAGDRIGVGYLVEDFVEKPDKKTAEYYLESSKYFWNASIFMAKTEIWLKEYCDLSPDLYAEFKKKQVEDKELNDTYIIKEIYESIKSESVDYALLEKSKKVSVIPVEMQWSDLGSWESIYKISEKDSHENVVRGNVIAHDTKNSLIFSNKKLVTSVGVDNLIIVETEDALLVCDMRRSQDVKKLVETLKKEERHEYKFHTKVIRPWGISSTIMENSNCKIKFLELYPQKNISLQIHKYRSEHWVVLKGTAEIQRGEENIILNENKSTYIPKGMKHRLGNPGKNNLEIIEVQYGDSVVEEDIERI